MTAGGLGGKDTQESFTFTTNNGATPTIYSAPGQNCGATISKNNLTLNGLGSSASGGGGLFRISTPQSFTSLTITGPGGEGGSILAFCEGSLVPAPPDITGITPNITRCLDSSRLTETLTVNASAGGNTISYKWYSNTSNSNTGGQQVATTKSYQAPTATSGTTWYYVVATSSGASTTSKEVKVEIDSCPPSTGTITATQPTPCVGAPTSLKVTATSTSPEAFTYKWYSNTTNSNTGGTPISGETTDTYAPSTATASTMYYYAEVTNSSGTTPSNPITIKVSNTGDCLDSDGDGIPDIIDLDSDNDGILDTVEGPISVGSKYFRVYSPITDFVKWELQISGEAGANVTVTTITGAKINATIPASGVTSVTLLPAQLPSQKVWGTATVNTVLKNDYITVESDKPVNVLQEVFRQAEWSQESAVVYPKGLWGKKYTVSARDNDVEAFSNSQGITVFSATDNNTVTLKNSAGSVVASFTLDNGDNYVYSVKDPISGLHLEASDNVGVIQSSSCVFSVASCDNILEYLLPDRLLGTKFLTASSADNSSYVFVTATEPATKLYVNNTLVKTLNAYEKYMYELPISQADIIVADKPVQAMKYNLYGFSVSHGALAADPSLVTMLDNTKATFGPVKLALPPSLTLNNFITLYVKTIDTGKMRYNGNAINGWRTFPADPKYSVVTLSIDNGMALSLVVTISSINGDVPFLTDWYGQAYSTSEASTLVIGGIDLDTGKFSPNSARDTDGDGIPDYLDLDSDNDGCLDAIEGGDNVKLNQLVPAGGTVTVGVGSTAQNLNLCGLPDGSCVDAQGVPTIVNPGGAADVDGLQGQGIGDSVNAAVQSPDCTTANCTKPSTATGTPTETKTGISIQQNRDTWPEDIPNGWIALEAKTKGFVITRVADDTLISEPKEGMLIYDESAKCVKLYDGTKWGCLEKNCD